MPSFYLQQAIYAEENPSISRQGIPKVLKTYFHGKALINESIS